MSIVEMGGKGGRNSSGLWVTSCGLKSKSKVKSRKLKVKSKVVLSVGWRIEQ